MLKTRYSKLATNFALDIFYKRRILRRISLVIIDIIIILFCNFFIYWNSKNFALSNSFNLSIFLISLGIPIYLFTEQYKGLTKFLNSFEMYKIIIRNLFLFLLIFLISLFDFVELPATRYIFQILLSISGLSCLTKLIIRDLLINLSKSKENKEKTIAIYGANLYGAQLERILRRENSYKILNFFDDNKQLFGRNLNGLPIFSLKEVAKYKDQIDQVFICVPSIERSYLRKVFDIFRDNNLPVLQIPSLKDLTENDLKISHLKQIEIEDIIGRDIAKQNTELLSNAIKGTVVLITGAGGSIGSEICNQILHLKPKELILLDSSEPNLYQIEKTISKMNIKETIITTILGSACDKNHMRRIFSSNKIDIVFHAAAYKHVPLVEKNPLVGIYNNVVSTRLICSLVLEFRAKKFILISTDKAVRPTNIMGASKRLSELVVQAFSQVSENQVDQNRTCFCMVRFGNVLGSSGSVVPLFKEQIANGGPITITHEKVVRYFMTISEASNLVLQASVIAKGGDVLLLDMGEPTLIKDLAKRMIHSSGLSIKTQKNPKGDIEIKYIGLRPGEKLFEELLINAKSFKTENPLIYRAVEESFPPSKIFPGLDKLERYLASQDIEKTLNLLNYFVPEWVRKK